ncbi:uncharacterized protein SPAPADRAFT_56588 [Spathaspora passalidarum NRRL Y-27907]|uniref:Uncharacterized protein n=1 Tax=Spathaspora passalidarum (strain NRRL Y-27907 / 11-Y1) TaxID=619300 RepID=G3ARY2_SPAPN|nr:uncharacterized protein SPAPADRAFT_56588 [Spathaspora passalidarum NRRL Y-27907]EGW31831.1 hypothetical protein SPAPADRAFT_56588 [Spathaspora passalidarum NRRL Y-27907]
MSEKKSEGNSILKTLTSSSTWVSPFRSNGETEGDKSGPKKQKVSLLQQFKESNKIDKIKVPEKFTRHPTLEAEKRAAKEAEKKAKEEALAKEKEAKEAKETKEAKEAEEATGDAEAETEAEAEAKTEPIEGDLKDKEVTADISKDAEDEADLAEQEEVEPVAPEKPKHDATPLDNTSSKYDDEEPVPTDAKIPADVPEEIEEDKEEEPVAAEEEEIELVTQPTTTKSTPAPSATKEIEDKLKEKPILLKKYQDLSLAATSAVNKEIDDPHREIDLGSGLKMTQAQLMEIAAKRVAPVLANINEEVSKTRQEDEIKHQQDIDAKTKKHEGKLQGEFQKYLGKLGKKKDKFNTEIEGKLANLTRSMKEADDTAVAFDKQTKDEIETSNKEYEDRETKAVEQHETDKENLIKNHEELVTTKKQELEDAIAGHETTTQEIETLQEQKNDYDNKNSELLSKIEELEAKLNEETEKLNDLKSKHTLHQDAITANLSRKDELDKNIATSKENLDEKKKKHAGLVAEIGLLTTAIGAYGAKLASLHSDKEQRATRLDEAKDKYNSWHAEKRDMAEQVAREHERKRIEAEEEYQTRKHQEELERQRLKEERERQEQEEKEEQERKLQKEREERERLEKEQAEWEAKEKLVQEQQKREEEERRKNDPEIQLAAAIKKREEEQKRLEDERAEQDRLYQERLDKEKLERESLEREIAELQEERAKAAELERKEAEDVAQAKLLQIQKLKDEHDAKLSLYQKRLEFENLQKQRLSEEVENLKKIRALREEKLRLANETAKDPKVEEIKKLIQDRELEVERLTKKIELDQPAFEAQPFLGISNEVSAPGNGAIPKSKDVVNSKESNEKKNIGTGAVVGAAATGAAVASTIGAVAAQANSAAANVAKSPSKAINGNTKSSAPPPRKGSLSDKLKSFGKKLTEASPTKPSKQEPVKKKEPVPKKQVAKSPISLPADNDDASSWEIQSVYELVSDSEFESHKNDPNYFEVSDDEFDHHKTLEKNKNLFERIAT